MTEIVYLLWFFLLGLIVSFLSIGLLLKKWFGPLMKVRLKKKKNPYLLRVHRKDGTVVLRVGFFDKTVNSVTYKLDGVDHLITLAPGVVQTVAGVKMIDVVEGETAPYNFEQVLELKEESEEGKDHSSVVMKSFRVWDDSPMIMTIIKTALIKPRYDSSGLNIDWQKLLMMGVVIVGIILIVLQLAQTGNGSAAANVIQ